MKKRLGLKFMFVFILFSSCLRQTEVKYTFKTYYKCTNEVATKKDSLSKSELKTAFNLCISKYENLKKQKFN